MSAARDPPGPEMLPYPGPATPSFPAGSDDERVEPQRTGDGPRGGAVLERCERLGDSDERDPRRVERDAVGVRVDRALEPGDELVGPAEDRPPPPGLPLPAGDADRKHARAAGDAVHLGRAFRPHEQARQLRAVPLETRRVLRARLRDGVVVLVDDVEAFAHLAEEVWMGRLDPGVEQRDRHAAAVDSGQVDVRPRADARREAALLDQLDDVEAGYVTRTG